MNQISSVTTITDKGYILLPFRMRRALGLKPHQSIKISATGKDKKIEIEPMLTLDEVFAYVKSLKPQKKGKRLTWKEEEQLAHEAIAENVLSEMK